MDLTTPSQGLQTKTRYNPGALTQILANFGPSALFFVFAHESGHHFDLQFNHPSVPWRDVALPPTPLVPLTELVSWNNELRADAWGGCALAATGRDLLPTQALQQISVNIHNNPDVPPAQDAQRAIAAGYNACTSQQTSGQGSTDGNGQTVQPSRTYEFGKLAKKPPQTNVENSPEAQDGDLCDGLNTAIGKIKDHFSSLHSAEKNDIGNYVSSFVLPGATKCVIADPGEYLQCTMASDFDELADSVKACLTPLNWTASRTPSTAEFLPPPVDGSLRGSISLRKLGSTSQPKVFLDVLTDVKRTN
jgi:hypothetical protein